MIRLILFGIVLMCASIGSNPVLSYEKERIIGGSEARIDQFPYLVSVSYLNRHRCGGVIFHFTVVLISANCVIGLFKDELRIKAGITNLNDEGIVRPIEYIIYHEEYSSWDNIYDIALLTVVKAFSFTDTIHAIVLASPGEEIAAGSRGLIAGWGALTTDGAVSSKLEYRDVYVYSKKECAERYSPYKQITDDQMCAGPWFGNGGVCYGDFGGPLVIGNRLFGILSWSIDCGSAIYPPVYVKISVVNEWIAKTMFILGFA